MKINKTTIELLELLKETIKEDKKIIGMCRCVHIMHLKNKINKEEYLLLNKYISDNDPGFRSLKSLYHWWYPGLKKPRIEWLEEHINFLNLLKTK